MAAIIDFAISVPHRRVLRRDVGGISHNSMVLTAKNMIDFCRVLRQVMVAQHPAKPRLGSAQFTPKEVPPVQQAVPGRKMQAEGRCRREPPHIRCPQSGPIPPLAYHPQRLSQYSWMKLSFVSSDDATKWRRSSAGMNAPTS